MSLAGNAKSSSTKSTKEGTKNTKEIRAKQDSESTLKLAEKEHGILYSIFLSGFLFESFVPTFVRFVSSS